MKNQARLSAFSALRFLPVLFFFSGASSLIFETVFTRLLTYTFGNTAHAVSTVLAAFLGGLALGAFSLGRWADRRPPSLKTYGGLELLVGVYCFFIPQLFAFLTTAYVWLYHLLGLGPTALTALRFGLASLVILLPTFLMGGTLPVLARYVAACCRDFEPQVSRLYAWNTLGAAVGTLGSTYLLMPSLGVQETIWLACAINFAIFLSVASLAGRAASLADPADQTEQESHTGPHEQATDARAPAAFLLAAAFLTGAVALAYEVVWTHALSFLVGNTVYAFGVMLFTFLLGLGGGAQIVGRGFPRAASWGWALAVSQVFLSCSILISLPFWSRIPDLFAHGLSKAYVFDVVGLVVLLLARMVAVGWAIYRRRRQTVFPWRPAAEFAIEGLLLFALVMLNPAMLSKYETTYFVTAELLRFLASFYLLIVPALFLGMSFPLLLNLAGRSSQRVGGSVGGVYAANTAGAILGSVVTGFFVLPHLGSFTTLRASAGINLALGIFFAIVWGRASVGLERPIWRRRLVRVVAASTLGIALMLGFLLRARPNWDARRISRGSYVYFNQGWPIDRVLYLREDVQGGLTSVVDIGPTRTLLTNGKFQGNNSGEVGAQIRFVLDPILFTGNFDRALVIGLGTGNSLRAVARFPFRDIDAVEIAPHIVEAARLWFADVNARVFDRDPRVHLSIADGRNFLLLSRRRYDLVTMEITSIWISGEADLYNREFYELCRAHLTEHGVLQQWVQMHHLRTQDFLVILNTAAQVFPHVAFFLGPEQGVLVASASPLECDYRRIETFDGNPGVRQELTALGVPSISSLLSELMLHDDSMRQALAFLPELSGLARDFASTDYRPYLEYQTPKGNSLPYDTVSMNVELLRRFRPSPLPPSVPIRNLPSENEKNLIFGYIAEAAGDKNAAAEYFRKVEGRARSRAQAEIVRIQRAAR